MYCWYLLLLLLFLLVFNAHTHKHIFTICIYKHVRARAVCYRFCCCFEFATHATTLCPTCGSVPVPAHWQWMCIYIYVRNEVKHSTIVDMVHDGGGGGGGDMVSVTICLSDNMWACCFCLFACVFTAIRRPTTHTNPTIHPRNQWQQQQQRWHTARFTIIAMPYSPSSSSSSSFCWLTFLSWVVEDGLAWLWLRLRPYRLVSQRSTSSMHVVLYTRRIALAEYIVRHTQSHSVSH